MQDNNREMHKIDEALYFVIEEKTIRLNWLIMESNSFRRYWFWLFVLPDIGTEIAAIEKKNRKDAEAEEKKNYSRFWNKKANHPYIDPTLKAYSFFEKILNM
jgi:preprotein translocase subunit SecA